MQGKSLWTEIMSQYTKWIKDITSQLTDDAVMQKAHKTVMRMTKWKPHSHDTLSCSTLRLGERKPSCHQFKTTQEKGNKTLHDTRCLISMPQTCSEVMYKTGQLHHENYT